MMEKQEESYRMFTTTGLGSGTLLNINVSLVGGSAFSKSLDEWSATSAECKGGKDVGSHQKVRWVQARL